MKTAKYLLALATLLGIFFPWYKLPGLYSLNALYAGGSTFRMVSNDSQILAAEATLKICGYVALICILAALVMEFIQDRAQSARKWGFIPMTGAFLVTIVAFIVGLGLRSRTPFDISMGLIFSLVTGAVAAAAMFLESGLFGKRGKPAGRSDSGDASHLSDL